MTKKPMLYLVGVDGSEPSRRAVEFAAEHAAASKANLLIAHIIPWSASAFLSVEEATRRPLDKEKEKRAAKEKILSPLLESARAKGSGVEVDTYYTWGDPARALKDLSDERAASIIVVGRNGYSSITELVLGSVSNKIVHIFDIPVVLIP